MNSSGPGSASPQDRSFRCPVLPIVGIVLLVLASGGCGEAGGTTETAAGALTIEPDPAGRVRSFFGLWLMLGLAYALSSARRQVNVRLVLTGVILQVALGVLTLSTPGRALFGAVNEGVDRLLAYTEEGAAFVFGDLARGRSLAVGESVLPPPDESSPDAVAAWTERAKQANVRVSSDRPPAFVRVGGQLAFAVLPTIIFFSSLMAVLYHLGVMQRIVGALAWLMQSTMRTSGAETLSAAGNIFFGQTEAPLLVRPFIKDMTNSELMALMTGGFATIAGGVMVAFVALLQSVFPDIAGHLLCASMMSAPAALVVAKIMVPEADPTASKTFGRMQVDLSTTDTNLIDAAARGATDGLRLAANVGAMLIAFIALIALLNGIVGAIGAVVGPWVGYQGPVTVQLLVGVALQPLAWCMGVRWADSAAVASLLGAKTVINEFYAYVLLAEEAPRLAPRSMVIATYALCGFANLSSVAIQLGGISPLAPNRRVDLARLGLRAMIGGTLAAFMTACVIGMMI